MLSCNSPHLPPDPQVFTYGIMIPTTATWWEVHRLRHTAKEKVRLKSIPPYNHDGLNGLDLQVNSTVFEMLDSFRGNVAHHNMRTFRMVDKLGTQISEKKSSAGVITGGSEHANPLRSTALLFPDVPLPLGLQFKPLTLA